VSYYRNFVGASAAVRLVVGILAEVDIKLHVRFVVAGMPRVETEKSNTEFACFTSEKIKEN
jgi:hypothetical protein